MLLALLGPAHAQTTAPAANPGAPDGTYLLHLPGVGGYLAIDRLLTTGLTRGGIEADIKVYDWTNGNPGMPALGALERNKQEAKKIAQMIAQKRNENPDARIIVTGHSAGCGLAVWALENLPEDVQVDTLVMLAPALSPKYDLSVALSRVKGHAYAFNSEHDPILGLGTRHFGTIDRIMTDAAGRIGFTAPDGADEQQYLKLVQIPYDRHWMTLGNAGDHIGTMMPRFAARVIAPLILTGELPRPTTQPASAPSGSTRQTRE